MQVIVQGKVQAMIGSILVVDDDRDARMALAIRLTAEGFEVHEAAGGMDALEMCQECRFDAVLLDASMPDMNGFDVCRRMRQGDDGDRMRIFFVTGASTPSESFVDRCVETSGADGYFRKPFDARELVESVKASMPGERCEEVLP